MNEPTKARQGAKTELIAERVRHTRTVGRRMFGDQPDCPEGPRGIAEVRVEPRGVEPAGVLDDRELGHDCVVPAGIGQTRS
jgi:hypothetical protein